MKNRIDYERRIDLEGENNNLVTIEFGVTTKYLIINVFRSFAAQNNISLVNRFTMSVWTKTYSLE